MQLAFKLSCSEANHIERTDVDRLYTRVILALYRKTERPQRKEAEGMRGPIRKNVNYCWSERRLTAGSNYV